MQIIGYPNYSITKDGRIWTRRGKGRWLKPRVHSGGYLYVQLSHNGKAIDFFVHRLVLETFVGPCPNGMECRHLNRNRTDNKLGNLKWGTRSDNMLDAVKHGTHPGFQNAKLNRGQVKTILGLYNAGTRSQRELAKTYRVVQQTISDIICKRTWKTIGGSDV